MKSNERVRELVQDNPNKVYFFDIQYKYFLRIAFDLY